jgi:3-deoxy-manno-octulosonate cytidylyltransferase (CMP-KDO synthetase)
MKVIAVIPARYASTRLPAKLMQDLGGKTVILRTYDACVSTGLFDEVLVATDSELIFNEIISNGGKAVMSIKNHESGSDRIAEAVANISADVVINVQGDEPFTQKEPLEALIEVFKNDVSKQVDLASLMCPLTDDVEINSPNNVKVVTDVNGMALYFSRSVIPHNRDGALGVNYMKHIGVYAFRKEALMQFTQWPVSLLESIEKLEQLRYLENGKRIKMVKTDFQPVGIDTFEDLERARNLLLNN